MKLSKKKEEEMLLNIKKIVLINYLSLYLFIYYFFGVVFYTYYGVDYNVSVWFHRILFYAPLLLWISLILINNAEIFQAKFNKFFYILIFLYTNIIIYIIYHHLFGLDYITVDVTWFQTKVLFYTLFNTLLGVYIYDQLLIKRSQKFILFAWILYLFLLLINLNGFNLYTSTVSSAHLLIGDTFVILSIITIFLNFKNKYFKIVAFILVLMIAYLIKSRASFYSLLVVYIFFIIKEIGFKNFMLLSLFFFLIFISFYKLNIISVDNRMFGVLQGKTDGSLNERLEQFKYGIEAIKNNIFFGEYAGQIIVHESGYKSGTMGAYMHNMLSYWRQYGILFFLFFTYLYANIVLKSFKEWLSSENELNIMIFYIVLFIGVEIILFRDYSSSYTWFIMGLAYKHFFYKQSNEYK